MDIVEACKMIRLCKSALNSGLPIETSDAELGEAVGAVKRFLELARTDGELIHELEIADHLLGTPSGIRCVMPFVTSAQEILAVSARALFQQYFTS
jgi:hypothetical protein